MKVIGLAMNRTVKKDEAGKNKDFCKEFHVIWILVIVTGFVKKPFVRDHKKCRVSGIFSVKQQLMELNSFIKRLIIWFNIDYQ